MKLPKYESFSIMGVINLLIGIYIYKYLISLGFSWFEVIFVLIIYYIVMIDLYENLRKELNKDEDNKKVL